MRDELLKGLARNRYTPPSWVRHLISWRLLGFIDKHLATCWAGMVMWKYGYEGEWWPTGTCLSPDDYCGKFDAALAGAEKGRDGE